MAFDVSLNTFRI